MSMRPRLWLYGGAATVLFIAASIQLGEGALHIPLQFRVPPNQKLTSALALETDSTFRSLEVAALDGVTLRGSLFCPRKPNGAAVILLHGVASTRDGMLGHARFLLRAGYTCLLPDSRGHGISGGALVTYGLREADDVTRWAGLLEETEHSQRIYGLGESMGASVLIQALPREPRLRAAVAECSFDEFRHIATHRVVQFTGINAPWLFSPLVESGFLYVRARYGVRLEASSPAQALRKTAIPVLLIHGMQDDNIPPAHARALLAARPVGTQLWEVAGANHVNSLTTEPERFPAIVLAWFDGH